MSSGTYKGTYSSGLRLYDILATITSTGSVTNSSANSYGVISTYAGQTLSNAGHITASDTGGVGVYFYAAGVLTNTGSIHGKFGAVLHAGGTITNQGTISAYYTGVRLNGGVFTNGASGVILTSGYNGIGVSLTGSVTATNAGLIGVLVSTRPTNGYASTFGVVLNGDESFNNTGNIELYHAQNYTGTFTGVTATSGGTLTNSGRIQAGAAYYGFSNPQASHPRVSPEGIHVVRDQYVGMGVVLNDSTCFNSGIINAHNIGLVAEGASYVKNSGGIGADSVGLELGGSGEVVNSGAIGAFGDNYNAGVYMQGGTLINSGTIQCYGSYESFGVYLQAGTLSNNGVIESFGTAQSYGVYVADSNQTITNTRKGIISGLIGVDFTNASDQTLINAGTIKSTAGTTGVAVQFNSGNDLLVLGAGSDFVGTVDGAGGVNTLELGTGTGIGTLSGLGTYVVNFAPIIVDAGANWLLNGHNSLASGSTITDNGLLTLGGTTAIYGTVSGAGTLGLGGVDAFYVGNAYLNVPNLLLSGGTTTLVGPSGDNVEISANFVTTGGALAINGRLLFLDGADNFEGGTIAGDNVFSDDSVFFTYGKVSLSALTVAHAAVWQDEETTTETGNLVLGNAGGGSGQLNVDPDGGVFDIVGTGGVSVAAGGSGTIECAGLFYKTGGGGTSVVSATMIDTGTIAVTSGALDFTGAGNSFSGSISGTGTIQFGGGSSTISSGTTLTVAHATVSGGVLNLGTNLAYAGSFLESGGSVLLGGNSFVLHGAATLTAGTITGAGTFDTYGATSLANFVVNGGATWNNIGAVTETGKLTLGAAGGVTGRFSNLKGATLNLTGATGTAIAAGSAGAKLVNQGLLEKTLGTGALVIAASVSDTGTIAVNTGTLDFTGSNSSFSGTISGAGTLEFGGGTSTIASGTSLTVATVSVQGTATAVTLGSSLAYGKSLNEGVGATLALGANTLTLSGTSTIAGTVSGTGTLALANGKTTLNAGAALTATHLSMSGGTAILGSNLTYAGSFRESGGQVSLNGKVLTLTGSVSFVGGTISGAASAAGSLVTRGPTSLGTLLLNGNSTWNNVGTTTETGTLTLGSAGGLARFSNIDAGVFDITANGGILVASGGAGKVINESLFEKTGGTGTSTVEGSIINTGTITVTLGVLNLDGPVSGSGKETIGAKGTLKVDASVAATQTISFAGTTGGELVLADPSGSALSFAGTIKGFGGSDKLDLSTFAYVTGSKPGWVQNGSGGTLTVTEGSKTAKITLFGQYVAAGFSATKDAAGDTLITYTTPAQMAAIAPPHR